ncbi:hypothetical protein BGZ65_011146, partial [Modicella reniformis]
GRFLVCGFQAVEATQERLLLEALHLVRNRLRERGLSVDGVRGRCLKKCPDQSDSSVESFCCQTQMLSRQADFMGQLTLLGEAVKDPEFKLIFAVPDALESVSIDSIRAYAGRAFWYMHAYRDGLAGPEAERQMKRYTSHRRVTERLPREKEVRLEADNIYFLLSLFDAPLEGHEICQGIIKRLDSKYSSLEDEVSNLVDDDVISSSGSGSGSGSS